MASEGGASVADVPEAERFGDVVGAAVVEPAAAEDPADAEDRPFHDAEPHHGRVEVLGAGGAVDAVAAEHRGYEFLVSFHGY